MADVLRDSPDDSDPSPDPFVFEPARDLPGAVLMIPNKHWGFEVVSADDHPGACVAYADDRREGVLLQGTDADHVRQLRVYHLVEPTPENGLHKRTAFRLVPRYCRLHRVKLYFPERHLGRLDGETILALQKELARLYPEK